MSDSKTAIAERILAYRFGDEIRRNALLRRLQSENRWTPIFTARAVDEYLKFMVLLAESASPLSPSDTIDQVWHGHLLHSREYREGFCLGIVGRNLDHFPALRGAEDAPRHSAGYDATRAAYEIRFGAPPPDIWPDKPFEGRFVRINLDTHTVRPRLTRLLVKRPWTFLLSPFRDRTF